MNKMHTSFLRRIFDKRLDQIIFFVTSVCDSRCIGCFNWQNINRKDDLTLREIEDIAGNMPEFRHVLFSGGEPTLRSDLPEICSIFRSRNKIESVGIPSNGLQPDRIETLVKNILAAEPQLDVGLYFSIDGMEETHDKLRGVAGSFKSVLESVRRISHLKKHTSRLVVTVNTVISSWNYMELDKLVRRVESLDVNSHTFDLLRGSINPENNIQLPPRSAMENINNLRYETRRKYLKSKGFLHRFFSLSKERYLIRNQMRVLDGKKLACDCLAGQVCALISSDGKVGLCELLPAIGDLRKENYDFNNIWNSSSANAQRQLIREHRCDCTHVCFLSMSIDHTPSVVFMNMPLCHLLRK